MNEREQQIELTKVIYAFSSRTCIGSKNGSYFTMSKNIGPEVYFGQELYDKCYIKDIVYKKLSRAAIIDIDTHEPGQLIDGTDAYELITTYLDNNNIHYISGVSSEDLKGNVRGYHIYIIFKERTFADECLTVAKQLASLTTYNNIDLFPIKKAIRLLWIQKYDGTSGTILHMDTEINNIQDVKAKCSTIPLQTKDIKGNSTTLSWKGLVAGIGSGLNMDELFAVVRDIAISTGLTHHPFSYTMVQGYYGLEKKAAEMKLYRWRKKREIVADIPSNCKGKAHLYATGVKKSKTAPKPYSRKDFELRSGQRHARTRDLVRKLLNVGYSKEEVLLEAQELFMRSYDGKTTLETHLKEVKGWMKTYRQPSQTRV